MTKSIHIINGDVSDYAVKVIVQAKDSQSGVWYDTSVNYNISSPGTAITSMIHSGQRIIIEEAGNTEYHWVKK